MRIPYAPSTPENPDSTTSDIYKRIAERRAPRPLIPLDLALLHSPPVADGWNNFLGAIRTRTAVDPAILELAVCRVGILNSAYHEWAVHSLIALKAGVSVEGLETVRTRDALGAGEVPQGVEGGLSAKEWAVVAYTDQMTRNVKVDDATFARLREHFPSERDVVEITATVAAYNCVSRFLVALDVGENNGKEMKPVEELSKTAHVKK
ncbi:hypothetical protein LTR66_013789 [Elasticomyces elasticus]|nr:hypothetical protein LTR66_013789 [Elasticomyces elasticus]KAK4954091.1 hypothetical protein LTR28_006316 [Elasticomyces elasticus]